MSNSGDVAQLYKNLIEEVIKTVRTDFVNMGVDEQVLNDLQALWEQKLLEANVFNPQDFPLTASRDYAQAGFFYPAPGVSVTTLPMGGAPNMAAVRPYAGVPYYAPNRPVVSAIVQMPQVTSTVGVRPAIVPLVPSTVASSQSTVASGQLPPSQETQSGANGNRQQAPTDPSLSKDTIPQFDGADEDDYDDEGGTTSREGQAPESKRTRSEGPSAFVGPGAINGAMGHAPTSLASAASAPIGAGGVDELGSDLDDEEEGDEVIDDENINDLVLCQYEKISRVRTRWRGVLRSGIVHINNRDYCFSKANMDFEW